MSGRVVEGYGVASGQADDTPYPAGSIALQLPHFRARGLDLGHLHPATINVEIDARGFVMRDPAYRFERIPWFTRLTEDFSFSRCQLSFGNRRYDGWVYHPHPETKPGHQQGTNIVEVITSWIDGIAYGDTVTLYLDSLEIDILR